MKKNIKVKGLYRRVRKQKLERSYKQNLLRKHMSYPKRQSFKLLEK